MVRSATIDLREGKYIIIPYVETTQGLNVITEPIFVYEALSDLIKNLDSILEYSKTGFSIEEGERIRLATLKKLYKAVGVRSYKAYEKPVIKSVSFREENGLVFFTPTRKERKGFSYFPGPEEIAPLSDHQTLMEALTKALAHCQ